MVRTNFYSQKTHHYDGIILRLRKGYSRQLSLTIFTRQAGLLPFLVPKGKKGYNQGFGSLVELSVVTFEGYERQGSHFITEYESHGSSLLADLSWDRYVYTQVFTEMVLALVPPEAPDDSTYNLILRYIEAIAARNVRVATIIAGWQLTACAGFQPDTETVCVYRYPGEAPDGQIRYYFSDHDEENMPPVPVSGSVRRLWQALIDYDWQHAAPMQLPRKDLALLEQLLYSYVEDVSGKDLKCRKALLD